MSSDPREQSLRVLIANERQERLGILTNILAGLGPVVVAAGIELDAISAVTRQEHPDVAIVAQSTLDLVLRRFAEYHNLEGAFARRAMIEPAKGILMATHAIDDQQAFDMLRGHSQQTGTKLLDLAEAIVHSHRLLARSPEPPPTSHHSGGRRPSSTA